VLDEARVVGAVLAWRTPPTIRDALYGKRRSLALLVLLTLAAVGSFVILGVLTISRPLRTVTEQAKRTANGERGAMSPVAYPLVREVDELSQALIRMAATLEQRADYIRDFAAHVSHEFKTPLGAIRGAVELLREHFDDMSRDERDRFLANLDADAERLTRLVTRLLQLARADVMSAGPERGPGVDGAAVIAQMAERFRAQGMKIEIKQRETAAQTPRLAIDGEALETILVNLLNNARQHGGLDVRVTLSLRKDGARAVLTAADDGPGVSHANAKSIFAPFFTTARKTGGTGLGLSIVQSLATAHGGALALEPSVVGAAFRVELPLAPNDGD
jgi:signal transduction histidine kinase